MHATTYAPGEAREAENQVSNDRFTLHPHHGNYLFPISGANIDNTPYVDTTADRQYHNAELVFQISLKYLIEDDWLIDGLDIHAGFTSKSWWQAYNGGFSRPFRETNYQPEIIFSYTNDWQLLGTTVRKLFLSFNHQSNGQADSLSRSWNRIIGGLVFTPREYIQLNTQVWWRVPESEKKDATDPRGDDNPNIEKYMGYGQLDARWKRNHGQEWSLMLRHNLRSKSKGAVELGWSSPTKRGPNIFIQYFNGYGESLIYFNETIHRLSVGFEFNSR